MIHAHFHQGSLLQIAFSSVWKPKEITVSCKRGEYRRGEAFFFPGNKRQRLRNFQIYYPARRSPWDRFDVNLKAYGDTSYSNNKRGSPTLPKITRPANRILPSLLPVIRFVFTPLRKTTSEWVLIDCPTPGDYSSREFFSFFFQDPKTRGQREEWTAAGSLRSSGGKSTYCTSLAKR